MKTSISRKTIFSAVTKPLILRGKLVGAVRFELIFGIRRNTLKTKDDQQDQVFRPFIAVDSRSIKMNVNDSFQLGIVRKNLLADWRRRLRTRPNNSPRRRAARRPPRRRTRPTSRPVVEQYSRER